MVNKFGSFKAGSFEKFEHILSIKSNIITLENSTLATLKTRNQIKAMLIMYINRVATFESVQNSLTFPWQFPDILLFFPDNLFYFFQVKNKNYPQKTI